MKLKVRLCIKKKNYASFVVLFEFIQQYFPSMLLGEDKAAETKQCFYYKHVANHRIVVSFSLIYLTTVYYGATNTVI